MGNRPKSTVESIRTIFSDVQKISDGLFSNRYFGFRNFFRFFTEINLGVDITSKKVKSVMGGSDTCSDNKITGYDFSVLAGNRPKSAVESICILRRTVVVRQQLAGLLT